MQNNGLIWFFILNYLGQNICLLRAELDYNDTENGYIIIAFLSQNQRANRAFFLIHHRTLAQLFTYIGQVGFVTFMFCVISIVLGIIFTISGVFFLKVSSDILITPKVKLSNGYRNRPLS